MNPRNFLAELKRRNVYKVAVAYAVIAWLLIQAGSILFPTFEAPGWVMKVFVVIIAAGFVIALFIAWAFEMTPEGMKRTENISPNERIPQWSKRKFATLIVSVLLLATALLVFKIWMKPSATLKSIAVLPFENRSRDPENLYFTEGVQDEILTRLAKVADLKVISRTSTQKFKSSPEDLTHIAQQLGVANILEGSVQKSEDQVRVNVQLINATTNAHLWGETFDRKLTDIFAVESEIAKSIADRLQAKLTGSEAHAISARPTENTEAYQLYLKGRFFWNKRTGPDLRKALEYFQQAIDKDPRYALAYAGLADTYVLLSPYGSGTPADSFPAAKKAARKAIELDETLGEAHASLAQVLGTYDFDFAESIREFERAIALNPNYATAHHWFGNATLLIVGEFDRAIAEGKRARELDPLSVIINADLGADYAVARRYDEAVEQLRKALEMEPRFYYTHWNLGEVLQLKGDLAGALAEYQQAAQLDDDPLIIALIAQAHALMGRREEAIKLLEQLEEMSQQRFVSDYSFAIVHIALGEKQKAIDWMERAYDNRAGPDVAFIKVDPLFDPLRGDPRFEALVAKVFAPKHGKPSP
jgi:TolB-like protein/Tfp pilus assembly protein PilF